MRPISAIVLSCGVIRGHINYAGFASLELSVTAYLWEMLADSIQQAPTDCKAGVEAEKER
ncbi:MAG: hypothetical protein ACJASX_003580 [Limisphaerales bacterium]|jgi:hypothetical protein